LQSRSQESRSIYRLIGLTQQNSLFGSVHSAGISKQGTSYENGPNYLLAKPCNIHTLLDDFAIVYAKLLPSGASV
jgi:hypothetical protein